MTQSQALELLKLGKNAFLTGPAGSGKTYLLNEYVGHLREHGVGVAITASTGIAATHLGGQTIHSWSGMGIRDHLESEDLHTIANKDRIARNFKNTRVVVIDEVSMLHPYQLDMLDAIGRHILDAEKPFGGLQIILSGDFFQLPPISTEGFGGETFFAYECNAWNNGEFQVCYLHEQFRQGEDPLLDVLNSIRRGEVDEYTKEPLRTRYKQDPEGDVQPTRLYARNVNVDTINARELEKIEGKGHVFAMETKGFSQLVEALKRSCLAPETLTLKVGAEVMFVKNAVNGAYVNGTRGTVEDFDSEEGWPIVRTFDGEVLVARPEEWRLEENGVVRASLTQVPLRLAWAITIHKSQGMTLDAAEVDLSDAFEPGMGYVALSRVRALKGLKLMGLNEIALSVHPKILVHDKKFQEWSHSAAEILKQFSAEDIAQAHDETLIERFGGTHETQKVEGGKIYKKPSHEQTRDLIAQERSIKEIARERGVTAGTVLGHMETLKQEGDLPDIAYLWPEIDEFEDVVEAFREAGKPTLTPIHKKFKGRHSFETLKLARLYV